MTGESTQNAPNFSRDPATEMTGTAWTTMELARPESRQPAGVSSAWLNESSRGAELLEELRRFARVAGLKRQPLPGSSTRKPSTSGQLPSRLPLSERSFAAIALRQKKHLGARCLRCVPLRVGFAE